MLQYYFYRGCCVFLYYKRTDSHIARCKLPGIHRECEALSVQLFSPSIGHTESSNSIWSTIVLHTTTIVYFLIIDLFQALDILTPQLPIRMEDGLVELVKVFLFIYYCLLLFFIINWVVISSMCTRQYGSTPCDKIEQAHSCTSLSLYLRLKRFWDMILNHNF